MAQRPADKRTPHKRWALAIAFAGLAYPASAQELNPQAAKQRGGFFIPMVTAGEIYDSNLFFTQFPESDLVTRLTAGLQTGYRSTPFTIDLQASRAADYFERHPEFNTTRARTLAQATLSFTPIRPMTFSLLACYLDTKTPSELNLASGLAVGRSLASRASATPVLEIRSGTLSTFTFAFPVAHDELDGRVADTKTGIVGFDRRISRRNTLGVRYEHRWFDFSGGSRFENSTADVAMLGWVGEISEHSLLILRAGPRYGKNEWSAEILATLKRKVKHGLVTMTYSKTQATTLGKTGALDIQSLSGTLAMRVAKKLEIASGPGIYRNTLRGNHLMAMRMNVEALWQFASAFHLGASYSFDLQQPDFAAPGHIGRSALQVRIITSPRQKVPLDPTSDEPVSELD